MWTQDKINIYATQMKICLSTTEPACLTSLPLSLTHSDKGFRLSS